MLHAAVEQTIALMSTSGPPSHPVFMVEAYLAPKAAGERRDVAVDVDGSVVVEVIDIPSDEVALFLVIAADAAAAGEVIRQRGLRPIRVVPARWDRGSRNGIDVPGDQLGNHPM